MNKKRYIKYIQPDMRVFDKQTIRQFVSVDEILKKNGIGDVIVCTGNGGIMVGGAKNKNRITDFYNKVRKDTSI